MYLHVSRLPDEHLAFAEANEIAAEAAIGAALNVRRWGKAPGREPPQVQRHENRRVRAIITERWQQRRGPAEEGHGAALHAGPEADAGLAEQQYRPCDERHAGKIAGGAADGDEPAAHGIADLIARLAVDENDAAAHAEPAAAIAGADQVSRVAMHVNLAAAHLGPDPIAGVAEQLNLAAGHLGAQVHSGTAVNLDAPARH